MEPGIHSDMGFVLVNSVALSLILIIISSLNSK